MITLTGSEGFIGSAIKTVLPISKSIDLKLGLDYGSISLSKGVLIHCGATANVVDAENNKEQAYENNVKKTIKLLENNNWDRLIFFSSAAANNASGSYYGYTKLTIEEYIKSNIQNYTIVRPYNVVGYYPGIEQISPNNLIPSIKRNIINRTKMQVYGKGVIRDYIDVMDVAKTVQYIIKNDIKGCYDLCSGLGRTTESVLQDLCIDYEVMDTRIGDANKLIGRKYFETTVDWNTTIKCLKAYLNHEYDMNMNMDMI